MNTENKLKEYSDLMSIIYANITTYSDEELNEKLNEAYSKIPYDMEVNDVMMNKIISERVDKYCKEHNIDKTEYDGCFGYKCFKIPIGGLSREESEKQIYQLMSEYHEYIQRDDNLGTIKINGNSQKPINKDYWIPLKNN